MIVVDLDMQIMEDAEANYQVRADLASEGWHYGEGWHYSKPSL